MKKIISVLFITALVVSAKASTIVNTFEGALRSNAAVISAESYQAGVRGKSEIGAQAFFISKIKLADNLSFRTGAGLVMRDSKAEYEDYDALPGLQSVTILVSRMFFDIPIGISYDINNFEIYASINAANKLSSSIDVSPSIVGTTNNSILDEKKFVTVPVLGFNYSTSPTSKIGLFYESEQNYSRNWNQTAIGLNAGFSL
jgi:hypothetical protein